MSFVVEITEFLINCSSSTSVCIVCGGWGVGEVEIFYITYHFV